MNKKEQQKLNRLEAEVKKHDQNIKSFVKQLKDFLKVVDEKGINNSDDCYTCGLNIATMGVHIIQETIYASRKATQAAMLSTKFVNINEDEDAKEFVEKLKKKGAQNTMGCKDGKKKPCTGKKCGKSK